MDLVLFIIPRWTGKVTSLEIEKLTLQVIRDFKSLATEKHRIWIETGWSDEWDWP